MDRPMQVPGVRVTHNNGDNGRNDGESDEGEFPLHHKSDDEGSHKSRKALNWSIVSNEHTRGERYVLVKVNFSAMP